MNRCRLYEDHSGYVKSKLERVSMERPVEINSALPVTLAMKRSEFKVYFGSKINII
jgi:hypothetical protein